MTKIFHSPIRALKTMVALGIVVCILMSHVACKGHEETPQEVDFTLEIEDHVTGQGRTITKKGYTNTGLTITTAETEISGVVSDYIAVQDLSTGKILGSGTNGSTSFSTGNSTNYRVIRFHDGPGMKELYDEMTRKMGKLHVNRTSTWGRKDDTGATGNESVWTEVFNEANNVLRSPFWLGSMTTGGNENWYGFKKGENGKDISQRWIYVDSNESEGNQKRSALGGELPEYAKEFNNLFDVPTQMTFCKWQSSELSDKGIGGYRFAYAMSVDK